MTIKQIFRVTAWLAVVAGLGASLSFGVERGGPFPLQLSADGRYLVDQSGQPFLIQGDSPWSLIVQLTIEEAEQYLDDRRDKGFNLVMVNLLEHQFCDNPPYNRYGEAPFVVPGDYATPNEAYFAHADAILNLANQKGIVVLLTPSYLGYGGGSQGWYQEMLANGPTVLRDYGRYIGQRYRDFDNIIWLHGGDFSPPAPQGIGLVNAIVEGMLEFDDRHLHTAHCGPGDSASDIYPGAAWLDLNTTYSYDDALYARVLDDYNRPDFKPFFMLESAYEDDFLSAPPQRTRRQAWWSNLCGTTGQIYGNYPIWPFDSGWQTALDSPGADNMRYLGRLFDTLPWWEFMPDQAHAYVIDGYGVYGSTSYVTAAYTPDQTLLAAYIPPAGFPGRTLTVNVGMFAAPVFVQWYDPTDGGYTMVSGSPFANAGSRQFAAPGYNAAGDDDWALLAWTTAPCDLPGDLDCECHHTVADLGEIAGALAGPGVPAASGGCRSPEPDYDQDGDVDLVDFGAFQAAFR